jgi:beta-lactamase class A
MMALRALLTEDDLKNTFAQVGVPFTIQGEDLRLSVKQYASFFRILYNASYLNRENSEYALSVLARIAFDQGLRGTLPQTMPIAHKFGERSNLGTDGPNQLHDCGILYYPESPYLLCVMTRGDNIPHLQQAIQAISDVIYKDVVEINSQKK